MSMRSVIRQAHAGGVVVRVPRAGRCKRARRPVSVVGVIVWAKVLSSSYAKDAPLRGS
jgi:hypothetical protein